MVSDEAGEELEPELEVSVVLDVSGEPEEPEVAELLVGAAMGDV